MAGERLVLLDGIPHCSDDRENGVPAYYPHAPGRTWCRHCWPPRGRGRGEAQLSVRRFLAHTKRLEALTLRLQGLSYAEIGRALGRSKTWAYNAVMRDGLLHVNELERWERAWERLQYVEACWAAGIEPVSQAAHDEALRYLRAHPHLVRWPRGGHKRRPGRPRKHGRPTKANAARWQRRHAEGDCVHVLQQ